MFIKVLTISIDKIDKTCISGSTPIDSIATSPGMFEYVKGYKLINYNDIILSDHRGYIVDISFKAYFEE